MATYRVGGITRLAGFWRRWAVNAFIWAFHLLDRRPALMRALMTLLRARPVWTLGRTAIVTHDRQVANVLGRDDDFPLPEGRADKFLTGAFVLGMTRTPQFELERAELECVLPPADAPRVRDLAWTASQRCVAKHAPHGTLDVVTDLSTPVGVVLLTKYFGISPTRFANDLKLTDDLQLLGAMIASADSARQDFQRDAEAAAVRVFRHIDEEIAVVEGGLAGRPLPSPPTVLQHLIDRWQNGQSPLDRDGVRRNMTGVLLPGTALVTRAFATGLVQILKRPRLRRIAEKAAAQTDWPTLEAVALEAIRFHPVFPFVPRHCPHETTVAGFKRTYRIRAGRDVYAAVSAAMFDPDSPLFGGAGDDPSDARLRERRHYRHFGGGIHTCLGQHVALAQIAAMLAAVLTLPNVRRSSPIVYAKDGISPEHLSLTFTPQPAQAAADAVTADDVVTLGG